jgi:hypothetical protein
MTDKLRISGLGIDSQQLACWCILDHAGTSGQPS